MKTLPLFGLLLLFVLNSALAQHFRDSVAQPAVIIGKIYNEEGQCVDERTFECAYNEEGRLTRVQRDRSHFDVSFENGFVHKVNISHYVEHGSLGETRTYTYQNGLLSQYVYAGDYEVEGTYRYTYDDFGNLTNRTLTGKYNQNASNHWFYEYADHGKTKTESHYHGPDNEVVEMKLREKNTWHYNDFLYLTEQTTETFDAQENLTQTSRVLLNYFSNDIIESETSQKMKDGQWVNTSVIQYILNEQGQVAERKTGVWSETQEEWTFTHKTVYEYNEAGCCQKVSFFQWKDGRWARGWFEDSPLWFDAMFDFAQEATQKLCIEEYNTLHFSEFEISYTNTKRPFYRTSETYIPLKCEMFPNPGSDRVTVSAPLENGVIRFYDTQGRMVFNAPFDFSADINTSDWDAGLYIWEIWRDNLRKAAGKWVKRQQ